MPFINFLIRWFAENKFIANVLMLMIFACAFIMTPNIAKQIFPSANLQGIFISSVYPGASTKTVERDVCLPIENTIRDINNISTVITTIKKQTCSITVFFTNYNLRDETLAHIESNIDAIGNFPAGAQTPNIYDGELKRYVTRVIINGETELINLYNLAKTIKNDLSTLNISSVDFENNIQFNTLVEVSRENLEKHRVSLIEIAEIIKSNNKDISSGEINNSDGKIAIQSLGNIHNINDLEKIEIRTYPDGANLLLGDIARIKIESTEASRGLYYDGKPAISLLVEQGGNKNLADVSNKINTYLVNKRLTLPKGIQIVTDNDVSVLFNARMSMLIENALFGLLLVFICLFFFLNFRLALWVSIGIPIAFSGALIALYLLGDSLNMISTFAFLLVLGIIVDDAIVVGESIYNQQKNFVRGTEGAIIGASLVARPVLYAVLTSMIMFAPLLFIPGSDGILLSAIPVVAIAAIVFSIIESFFILPSHLAGDVRHLNKQTRQEFASGFKNAFERFIKTTFKAILAKALQWRYPVAATFLVIFVFAVALVSSGWVKARLISTVEADEAYVTLELPEGTSLATTKTYIKQLETAAFELKQDLAQQYGNEQITHIRTRVGFYGDHTALIYLTFPSRENRKLSSKKVADLWRLKTGPIPIATRLEFSASYNQPGPNIDLQLSSSNSNELLRATQELHSLLSNYPSVYGVQNNIKRGNQEIKLGLKPSAAIYNINTQQLAAVVNQAFHGIYIDDSNNPDSSIIVRLPENERNKVWHLEKLLIPTTSGIAVPLSQVADINFHTGDSEIIRYNYKRSLNVSAFVDESMSSTANVLDDLQTRFLEQLPQTYPSVSWQSAGALQVSGETKTSLLVGFAIAIIAMYFVLILLFKSIAKPLIVLSAVPFGFVGALLGHWILGYDITLWSFAGMIAVSGVVVNDNVVLVDYINEESKVDTLSVESAVLNAGVARFRPIMLTTLTTIIGLVPMMFETSWEAQFLIPMVISIAFGEFFATFISLILVPSLYMIYNDIRSKIFTY